VRPHTDFAGPIQNHPRARRKETLMRNLLALAAFVLIVLGVVGYYRGWYSIKETTVDDGQRKFEVDVNTKKFREDVNQGKQEAGKILTEKK
jgi:hypothetical protein